MVCSETHSLLILFYCIFLQLFFIRLAGNGAEPYKKPEKNQQSIGQNQTKQRKALIKTTRPDLCNKTDPYRTEQHRKQHQGQHSDPNRKIRPYNS